MWLEGFPVFASRVFDGGGDGIGVEFVGVEGAEEGGDFADGCIGVEPGAFVVGMEYAGGSVVSHLSDQCVGGCGDDGEGVVYFAGGGVDPLVPYAGHGEGFLAICGEEQVGAGEAEVFGTFDEGVGDDEASLSPYGHAECGFFEYAEAAGVVGSIVGVGIAFAARVEDVEFFLCPEGGEAEVEELECAGLVLSDDGGGFADGHVGVRLVLFGVRGGDAVALFDLVERAVYDVSTAHGAGGFLSDEGVGGVV